MDAHTYNSLNEGQVFGHHVLEIVGDEHTTYVHLDKVDTFAVVREHVGGRLLGNEEDGLEGDLSLGGEVSSAHWVLTVLRETLVKLGVLFIGDIARPE